MKVSELAKELNIENEIVLHKLKMLKLKAKDNELSKGVAIVLRGELAKEIKAGKLKEGRKEIKSAPSKEQPLAKVETPQKDIILARHIKKVLESR